MGVKEGMIKTNNISNRSLETAQVFENRIFINPKLDTIFTTIKTVQDMICQTINEQKFFIYT